MLARCGEPLRDHLLNVAQTAKLLSEKLKLNLELEAYLSGLLHDVGKADAGAQRRIAEGCETERELGSPGHEILSAVIAFEVLRGCGLQPEAIFEVIGAILRHHQAMRTVDEALDTVRKWFGGRVAEPAELEAVLNDGLSAVGLGGARFTWPTSIKILEERLAGMQREFEKFYGQPTRVLRARLLSGLVMVADTYVAGLSAAKRDKKSLYKREVERFVESLRREGRSVRRSREPGAGKPEEGRPDRSCG
ncbi:MAG: CRISPR-associated endonuclease Cas3'' [Thermofilaceae archaeon]